MDKWQPPRIGPKKENEVECYTVAIGNLPTPLASKKQKKDAKEVIKFVEKLEGYQGLYPLYPKGTLLIFDTKNNAKIAKNKLDYKGVKTGYNIGTVFVDKKYIKG